MQVLTAPLYGETIYSWCATQHAMSANVSAVRTSQQLLGCSHAMKQHDLPASFGRLPILDRSHTEAIPGLLRKHTIGAFYWPFLGEPQRRKVTASISDGVDISWRRTLCASSRSRPTDHPLRWCAHCAFDDIQNEGRAYWHVAHQLPTSYACIKHRTLLQIAKSRPKSWQLPPQDCAPGRLTSSATSTAVLAACLSDSICDLEHIDVSGLRKAAILRLRDMGVIVSIFGVQHDRVFQWFSKTNAASFCLEPTHGLTHLADGHWIPALLWRRRMSHPVLWAVLWLALEWPTHLDACVAFRDSASGRVQLSDGQLSLLEFEQQSTARAPERVVHAFMASQSYGEVMSRLQVSRADIVRWLESDPSLRREWRQLLRDGKQLECESILRQAVLDDKQITLKVLEQRCGAAYRWMREHAPQKLKAMLQSIPVRLAVQPTLFDHFTG